MDKVFFKISMDFVCCLRCGCFNWNGLCMYFFYFSGEVSLQVQQFIIGMDYMVQVWFFQFKFLYKFVMFFVVQFGNVCFNSSINWNYNRIFFCCDFMYLVKIWVVFKIVFVDVGDVYCWFQCQEVQVMNSCFFFSV